MKWDTLTDTSPVSNWPSVCLSCGRTTAMSRWQIPLFVCHHSSSSWWATVWEVLHVFIKVTWIVALPLLWISVVIDFSLRICSSLAANFPANRNNFHEIDSRFGAAVETEFMRCRLRLCGLWSPAQPANIQNAFGFSALLAGRMLYQQQE